MVKVFVDSASSIKQHEKEQYGVEILPLRFTFGDEEYIDGINLSLDDFYHKMIDEKQFPKTSLPSLGDAEEQVTRCTDAGDDVIIITMSSCLSGTYNTLKMLFEDNPRVLVVDSKSCVGGERILVMEVNKYRDQSLSFIKEKLDELIPKIRIVAVPDTLEYLHRGGRLSRSSFVVGNMLQIKPIIVIEDGLVKVSAKALGTSKAMRSVADALVSCDCDENYPIIPSYTYNKGNLDTLIEITDEKYKKQMVDYDNLAPAVACHWGPGAYGYIFVGKK